MDKKAKRAVRSNSQEKGLCKAGIGIRKKIVRKKVMNVVKELSENVMIMTHV